MTRQPASRSLRHLLEADDEEKQAGSGVPAYACTLAPGASDPWFHLVVRVGPTPHSSEHAWCPDENRSEPRIKPPDLQALGPTKESCQSRTGYYRV
jgi:hypothetical protein